MNILDIIVVTFIVVIFLYYLEKFNKCELPAFDHLNPECPSFDKKIEAAVRYKLNEEEKNKLRQNNTNLLDYIKDQIKNYYEINQKYVIGELEYIASKIELVASGQESLLYTQIKKPKQFKFDEKKSPRFLTQIGVNNLSNIKLNLGTHTQPNGKELSIDLSKFASQIKNYDEKINLIIRESTYLSLGPQKLCIYYNESALEYANPNTNTATGEPEKYTLKQILELNEVGRVYNQLDLRVFVKNILEAVLVPQNWVNTQAQNKHYPYPLEMSHNIYSFPLNYKKKINGTGQKIGIVTYGKWFYNANEVDINFDHLIKEYSKGIPELNKSLKIKIATAPGYDPSITPSINELKRLKGAAGEGLLDLGIILSCCPGLSEVHIICLGNYSSDEKFMVEYAHNKGVPVLSVSWGSDAPRNDKIDEYISYSNYYRDLTICVSSGDYGGLGNDKKKPNNTLDPASSAYVLACGGTESGQELPKTLDNNYLNTVFDQSKAWSGSGGGISNITRPDYQSDYFNNVNNNNNLRINFKKKYKSEKYNYINKNTQRLVPDISGMAQSNWLIPVQFNDPDSDIEFKNRFSFSGGTSAVAPLYASLFTVINQHRKDNKKKPVGFINPEIYKLAKLYYRNYFRHITKGETLGKHTAQEGYDLATGLGVLYFPEIINHFVDTY